MVRRRREKKRKDYRTEFEKKGKPLYFKMSDGAEIRVLDFNIAENPKGIIFFIPGFITVFQSFEKALRYFAQDYRIYYFESREKITSKTDDPKKITVERSYTDIKEVVEQLGLNKNNDYFIVSSSYGGTLLIENLSRQWLAPKFAVMIGPTLEMKIPWFTVPLGRIFRFFMGPITKLLIRFFINVLYVDRKRDVEQREKYMRAVFENDPKKYLTATKEMRKYKGWHLLPKITAKCLIIGESQDKMHYCSERAADIIPDATLVDLETNEATHGKALVDAVYDFIDNLKNEEIILTK